LTDAGLELRDLPPELTYDSELGTLVSETSKASGQNLGRLLPLVESARLTGTKLPAKGLVNDNQALLEQLKDVLSGGPLGATEFSNLGPATAGARITTNLAHQLEVSFGGTTMAFVLVASTNAPPFFLGESEMSAGQLAQLSRIPSLHSAILNNALGDQILAFVTNGVFDYLR
jgi:hypothetical protein